MTIRKPYLLFLGDAPDALAAKTAIGVYEWRPNDCVGQLRLPGCVPKIDLPELDLAEAASKGAKTLLVGVVNAGGTISETWRTTLLEAIDQGMDIASGLHTRLSEIPGLAAHAESHGRVLHDVRHFDGKLPVGNGKPRSGRRLLTVGTDCSVGKMYTALAIQAELVRRGVAADFRATGQTGILIEGEGISVDAVIADFISGAVETLCPAKPEDHWDLVEGQGSLFHPSYAGVSLGLLHGAQPDSLVVCHEPTRTHLRGIPDRPLPSLPDCIDANLQAARVVRPDTQVVGVAINTSALTEDEGSALLERTGRELGLPCIDPLRTGVGSIVDGLIP